MNNEFTSLVKSLKVPLLSAGEQATLTQLQKQWEHWKQRELEHAPLRIEPHQNAAYDAFLSSPTAENEQKMLIHADRNLTGIRYALLRRACADLRARISAQAAAILRPVLQRISAALEAEHTRRREAAEPTIELRDGEGYKPSTQLSTGQKRTTILPILLLESENPLLIDQPEDNLDNSFIFEAVVTNIQTVKATRQLIFVTHNPNIPVLGEAERVVVMESDGEHGRKTPEGTVDECKESIVTLLEGGEEAFRKRGKRYQF